MTYYCKPNDPAVSMILRKVLPGFKGNKVAISVHENGGMSLTSYWSGGTRDYHTVLRLEDMTVIQIPENGSGFTATDRAFGPSGLPLELPAPGFIVVTHTTGNHEALRISVHAENATKLIPTPTELTWAEKVVLTATRSLKSSYGGKDRFRMANDELCFPAYNKDVISRAVWDETKAALIARGFLNKAGAITVEGRNAAGTKDLYSLRLPAPDTKLAADREVGETQAPQEV